MKNDEQQAPTQVASTKETRESFWKRSSQRLHQTVQQLLVLTSRLQHALTRVIQATWRHPRAVATRARLVHLMNQAKRTSQRSLPALRTTMRKTLILGGLVCASAIITLGFARFTWRTIPPGQVGVRYSKWNGSGVSMQDFAPGLHMSLPGIHKWYTLPAGTEILRWSSGTKQEEGSLLDVRTLDGTSVQLSLTIPFSVLPGEAHLLVTQGLRSTYRNQARAKAEQVLVNSFSSLRSEQFSSSDTRTALLTAAIEQLNASLSPVHLQAEAILLNRVHFSEAYEKKLVETQRERQRGRVLVARQLEDQEQQTILKKRAEIDRQLLDRRLELELQIEGRRTAGQAEAAQMVRDVTQFELRLRSDADKEFISLVAKGEAALALAKQQRGHLHGEILASQGGAQYLALQAARSTRFGQVVMNSNSSHAPNPLNMQEMLALFEGLPTNE